MITGFELTRYGRKAQPDYRGHTIYKTYNDFDEPCYWVEGFEDMLGEEGLGSYEQAKFFIDHVEAQADAAQEEFNHG